jgi:hypothetical protein
MKKIIKNIFSINLLGNILNDSLNSIMGPRTVWSVLVLGLVWVVYILYFFFFDNMRVLYILLIWAE